MLIYIAKCKQLFFGFLSFFFFCCCFLHGGGGGGGSGKKGQRGGCISEMHSNIDRS